ncbi:uncharacterized protein [Euphorbia lathyris]|uniref:uncharacterized protein n=1 Tax=Euphorbia lathyris TaxID=212925 RepID=UPI0033131108
MSRCFPYPPPGYLSNEVCGEAVRDPIKLKSGRENTITELDNKKRKDKKERKEKKDKKKNDKGKKELGYMVDTYKQISNISILPKRKEEEAERSDLTEEHEQPVCSQNFCHSPDSSGRGNKRKEDDTGSITKTHGNILRIRLPLQRHREPVASLRAEGLCSESVKAVSVATVPCREECNSVASNSEFGSEAAKVKEACVADLKAKACVEDLKANKKPNNIACNETKTDSASSHKKKPHKLELRYKSLIDDWIPPALELDQNLFDDSWLLEPKENEGPGCKRFKLLHGDQQSHERTSVWPCARYLSEADILALPYSVPF